ncbi:monovalent cation:proton antiporter-2 (CPA2) family protein [Salinimicrobium sp. GXAS 041]|uniref:monovalent cation:proton antiporter-2 (CPA2) family protein n=1 Tax=Salinimicrobium sp. GXAS 041 TaxID=3400806 RepID=UPI003C70CC5F
MDFPLLQDIVIILGLSVVVVLMLQRFKLPSILGFILTGIIIGPYGLSLIKAVHEVEILAEIGVILLLFVIGMELSIKQLKSMRKTVFFGGFLQVGLTVAVTFLIYLFLGFKWNEAVFVGFLFSLSSTAIVLKVLQDRNEITAPHGRNALGILIFQDIIVVPMMLVTPILAGRSTDVGFEVLELLIKSALVVAITYVSARYLVPRLMYVIARTKSKELFLLTTITLCFAVAFLTAEAGLSLAFGAFLAGLIISESDYSHQATSTILPFRELFTSFFFISIGMLLNLSFFMAHAPVILLLVVVVFILKGCIAAVATIFLKYPPRTVALTGLALFQIGEFAFILSRVGIENGLLTAQMNQYFLSVSIGTMLLTPFVLMFSERISAFIIRSQKWNGKAASLEPQQHEELEGLENHLLIIGFGINGTNLAKAARYASIPYVILELNADTVRAEKAKGEPIIYGDAVHEHILESVEVQKARVVVIAISDPAATKAIITNIRNLSQSVFIVVRTRYVKEIDALIALGADEVIPEEFETSIEIFSRVLHNYLVPIDELENLIERVRADNYEIFQSRNKTPRTITSSKIPDFKITCVRLVADSGKIVGKTISEANVRRKYGVNILAINRKEQLISSIDPDEKMLLNDLVFISGDQQQIEDFFKAVS